MTTQAEKKDLAKLTGAWDIAEAAQDYPRLSEGDLTIRAYLSKHPDEKETSVRRKLANKVKAGELVKVKCMCETGTIYAYRLPKESVI